MTTDRSVRDERVVELVRKLDADGPLSVRTLLSRTELCESDLHGMLAELRVAGLVTETTVAGQRCYETTDAASEALDLHG